MKTPKYRCSQQELYIISNLGWQSCSQYLSEFSAFKSKYTAAYVTKQKDAIAAAQSLPDEQRRYDAAESLRVRLKAQSTACLNLWQKLKRYIADAWPAEEQKTKLEAAGQDYYNDASHNAWSACLSLMVSGHEFIKEHGAALSGAGHMPAAFSAEFATLFSSFETLHQEFVNSEERAVIQTEAKIAANNDLYESLIGMFLDGQEIFKNQEAVQSQFVFEQVLLLVAGTGPAGLRGTVMNNLTVPRPVAGATVTILQTGTEVITDADGRYLFTQLAAGTYDIRVSAPDYGPVTVSGQVLQPGVTSTLNFSLAVV